VSTKPWSSRAAQPDSQPEAGLAPMKGTAAFRCRLGGEFHRLQRLVALRAAIVVVGRTVIRGSASIRSIR
jgi:hypothetical protein